MLITHDFHLHTKISLCAKPEATLDLYLRKASECGLKKIAITDHIWDTISTAGLSGTVFSISTESRPFVLRLTSTTRRAE